MLQEKEQNGKCKPNRSIVVTGYGPFGDHKINASWEAVKQLKDLWDKDTKTDEVRLITEEIPVCYDFVQEQVPNKWKTEDNKCNVIAMLHVGVSSIAKRVTLEEIANSDGYNKFDINGKCPENGRCISNQSCNDKMESNEEENICISSFFDVDSMVDHLNNSMGDGTAEKSRDAGRYLCEFVYFKSLYTMNRRALFIHVPPLDVVPAEKCAQAIKHITEYIIQHY